MGAQKGARHKAVVCTAVPLLWELRGRVSACAGATEQGRTPFVGGRPDVALLVAGTLLPDEEMCPRWGLCVPR